MYLCLVSTTDSKNHILTISSTLYKMTAQSWLIECTKTKNANDATHLCCHDKETRKQKQKTKTLWPSFPHSSFYKTSWSKPRTLSPWTWSGVYFGQSIYTSKSQLSQLQKQVATNALLVRFMYRLKEGMNRKGTSFLPPYESNYLIAPPRKVMHEVS